MSEETTTEAKKVDVYVHEKLVKDVAISDEKTPLGDSIYEITFDDDSKMTLTRAKFQAIQTLEKSDATEARTTMVRELGQKMYAMLCEYGVLMSEVDPTLNEIVRLTNDNQNHALDILWGKQHYDRSILDVNRVLLSKYDPATQQEVDLNPAPAEDTDGVASEGGSPDTEDKG